ncbi:hypothetical protein SALBM311S_08138 [Streptomyces alboniger]
MSERSLMPTPSTLKRLCDMRELEDAKRRSLDRDP